MAGAREIDGASRGGVALADRPQLSPSRQRVADGVERKACEKRAKGHVQVCIYSMSMSWKAKIRMGHRYLPYSVTYHRLTQILPHSCLTHICKPCICLTCLVFLLFPQGWFKGKKRERGREGWSFFLGLSLIPQGPLSNNSSFCTFRALIYPQEGSLYPYNTRTSSQTSHRPPSLRITYFSESPL